MALMLSQAVRAALECRLRYKIALDSPCDVYELITSHDLDLRFMEVTSLEGLYLVNGQTGQINVSSCRPSGLQRFTAAHELGHHIFHHGAMIDRDMDYKERFSSFSDDEKLADAFARFLLMPLRAVHTGFKNIGGLLGGLRPAEVYRVASWLGVGYSTLLHQMRFSLHMLSSDDFVRLSKTKPQQIKQSLAPALGHYGRAELWPMDSTWNGQRVHVRIGDAITGLANAPHSLASPIDSSTWTAAVVGETRSNLKGGGSVKLSVARDQYVGLYKYRYLSEVEDA